MVDMKKLKGRGGNAKKRFGDIPRPEDTDENLKAPEIAPAPKPAAKKKAAKTKTRDQKARGKTGRTEPFGTRVSQEFLDDFNEAAFLSKLKKVELLEAMLEAYRKKNGYNRKS